MEAPIGFALLYSFATHRKEIYERSQERVKESVDQAKADAAKDDDEGYDTSIDTRSGRLYEPGDGPADGHRVWGHRDASVEMHRFEYTGHDHVVVPLTYEEMYGRDV